MSCISIVLYIFALTWALLIPTGQVASNFILSSFLSIPPGLFAIFPTIQLILLILPFLPFAIFLKNRLLRAAFQTWVAAAFAGLIFSPVQLISQSSAQIRAIASIGLGMLGIVSIVFIGWLKDSTSYMSHLKSLYQPIGNLPLLLAFTALFFYPWLSWGAFGSPTDSLIMVVNAIVFGILIALILDKFLLQQLAENGHLGNGKFLFISLSASIAMFIFSSGLNFPFGGMQVLLMLSLPATTLVALFAYYRNLKMVENPLLAMMIIFSAALAAPMLLIDPDELALVINATKGEIGTWAIYSALVATGIALLFAIGIILWKFIIDKTNYTMNPKHRSVRFIESLTITLVLIAGGVLYYFAGQPGWHGEQIFVILKDQKFVEEAYSTDNYQDRRQLVYRTLVEHAQTSQADLTNTLDRFDIDYQPYYLVNAIELDGSPLLRLWLATRSEVDRVLDSPRLRPLPEEIPPQYGSEALPSNLEWNITLIEAQRVWQDFHVSGEGIIVGQSDSGVQWDHPELFDSYRGKEGDHDYNWLDPWNNTSAPVDKSGHGTHTLGTILGNNTGIAPEATWFACTNLARNLGNPAFYLDCMQFMLAPYPIGGDPFTDGDPSLGAHVMNNSWGCPELEGCDSEVFLSAVRNLRSAGIFVVASAGNDGPGCGTLKFPPANYADLFSVGAIDPSGELAFFSSIGPAVVNNELVSKPDLIAPGVDVLSSTPGNTYARYSGTSMAGPHVVGVVALMWAANPNLIGDIDTTTRILIESASPYDGVLPDCPGAQDTPSTAVGYGLLDAYRAVEMALQIK
jgi:hypothetical protein